MITDARYDHLRALCAAATPGPWTPSGDRKRWVDITIPQEVVAANRENDARFVAEARAAIPELLDEIDHLRRAAMVILSASALCNDECTVLDLGKALDDLHHDDPDFLERWLDSLRAGRR